MFALTPKADIQESARQAFRLFPNLIKPLRMLRDGGNADQENQDADDIGLEPEDRIGLHGKRSKMSSLQDFPVTVVPRLRTQEARQHSHRHSFRVIVVTAPATKILDLALACSGGDRRQLRLRVQNRLSEKPVEVGLWILFTARLPRAIDNHNGIAAVL